MISRKIEEPEFFKNYLESYPFSENYEFKAESFSKESNGIPILSINYSIQNSV